MLMRFQIFLNIWFLYFSIEKNKLLNSIIIQNILYIFYRKIAFKNWLKLDTWRIQKVRIAWNIVRVERPALICLSCGVPVSKKGEEENKTQVCERSALFVAMEFWCILVLFYSLIKWNFVDVCRQKIEH